MEIYKEIIATEESRINGIAADISSAIEEDRTDSARLNVEISELNKRNWTHLTGMKKMRLREE
jgi:hypothetical protein